MKIEATPAAVGRVRERLRDWLDELALVPDDQLAILVAVGEACTNTIEHAYGDGNAHLFRVEACVDDGTRRVLCHRHRRMEGQRHTHRAGNGLNIIARAAWTRCIVDRRATGTSVTLHLPPERAQRVAVAG